MEIKIINCTNFKSGMTSKILRMERNINPKHVENYFCNLPTKDWRSFYNIDFKDNKAMATANRLCADIFNNLRQIFDYRAGYSTQTLTSPQDLYVYDRNSSDFYANRGFFSIAGSGRIEKDKPSFELGTVFMPNDINKLDMVDTLTENVYQKKLTSTPHFLNAIVHEWLHTIFDKTLCNFCFNRNVAFNDIYAKYSFQELTDKEKEIVSDVISEYPARCKYNAYPELFAESWTKFICESLSEDCTTFKKNPLDLLKATPKEFQEILKKITSIENFK